MTTILEEFKRLEEARKRGEIAEADLVKLRQELTEMVEEAELATPSEATTTDDSASWRDRSDHKSLMRFALIAIGGLILCVLIGAWVFRDPTLALTLGVTVLAAVVIRASKQLED